MDSLIAAVRSGADAVYVGEKSFSARASAKNFDFDELRDAAAYCHIHGTKLYVTLNTIVFDDELERLKTAIEDAARADVDALIVQNPGVAVLAQKIAPELPLHASTQMSIHTASGVRALYEMGFKRVVLAREMSRAEIIEAAKIPIELEVFVHGALCMSVSGQCYFSAMLGSRSGNRGACAQTCRLPFCVGREKSGHALSLKDNSLIDRLRDLRGIGVASAKIEGRMKRPEYVAAAVKACRESLDLGFVTDNTSRLLRGVFSRTGFTDGYYADRRGREMFGTRTRDDVIAADDKLLSEIRAGFKDELRNVGISGRFTAEAGSPAVLEISDGENSVKAVSDSVCETAVKLPLDAEKCRAQLTKTGGTAYLFEKLEIGLGEDVSFPLSSLNALRRAALGELDKKRALRHEYKINRITLFEGMEEFSEKPLKTRAVVTGTKLGEAFKSLDMVFVPLFSDLREIERLKNQGFRIGVEIPRGMFGAEKRISAQLRRVHELGVSDALCQNIGALELAKEEGFILHGGFGLNLVNSYDLLWAREYGLADAEMSLELTFERLNRLKTSLDRGIVSYGYLPLMLCRVCPNKSAGISCKSCKNQSKMTDRKGKSFFLRCGPGYTEVLNCVPLYTADKELSKLSTSFHTLRFSVENYVENVEKSAELPPFSMLKDRFTHGLYKRGVE